MHACEAQNVHAHMKRRGQLRLALLARRDRTSSMRPEEENVCMHAYVYETRGGGNHECVK